MPLISVIIPVYNGEKTIRETINSVLNQTFQDFELIIINDGSQDATVEIVNSIDDVRIKVFSYPNAGPNPSRNRGVAQAKGEYTSFIDADDIWTPDKLEAQLKALQANSQAAVAYSWTDYIDESGQFSRQGSHISVEGDIFKNLLLVNFLENGSNPLIRSQALAEVGGFNESLTHAEDWDMWLRLAAHYHFVAVPSPQIFYRVSANSGSAKLDELEKACLQVIERACTQIQESLHLKKHSKANLYKYLTFKALEGIPKRRQSLRAIKFLWHTISNDPSLLFRKIIWIIVLRIAIVVLLPSQLALGLLVKKRQLFNLESLFLSNKLNPSELRASS